MRERESELASAQKRERERHREGGEVGLPDSQPWIKPSPIIGAFSTTQW